ncbi:ABC transporter substrate-binding protein [Sphingomonas sp. SUN039]|uniref:ABC transporter substrate-binding protein n=1 Tax=Sphingomonas sp. SUN039 TaxID=2937787 RepID=UPI002164BE22|nr:ABC transporter substrate-binding protein [Sphingomonas sp. SUN039]UVO54165.1 ABC transporter substrate-binding protein [Sphingomonas sp. SUN039]
MSARRLLLLALPALLASCSDPRDDGEIDVSVIGSRPAMVDPDRAPLSSGDTMLAASTAMGLVALDGNGQVEPALAESWIVTSDGLSTIFRIRQVQWPDGTVVTGDDVARSLNRAIAADSRNPMKPLLTAVDSFVGMTGRVVEVRLKVPRPNLLQLLAQPELGIRRDGRGTGPFRIARLRGNSVRLVPIVHDDDAPDRMPDAVLLRYERAALAIARFQAEKSDLVTGGTLADWPTVRAARTRPGILRFDAGQGLFGLEVVGKSTFLSTSSVRNALSMAIDRSALPRALDIDGWTVSNTVLPIQFDSAKPPAQPDWAGDSIGQRRAAAAERIADWRSGGRTPPILRIALPAGPGMRILFAHIAADWRRIGVRAVAVSPGASDIDLRLIDAVAPNASANWFLTRLSCAAGLVCDAKGDGSLNASRSAATLAARSARIADADADLTTRASFIPLGVPMRWSLVDPALSGWKENALGMHPLNELRPPRERAN